MGKDGIDRLTEARIAELLALEADAAKRSSSRWVCGARREDGTAQVYSPSLGIARMVVPIAETTDDEAEFIAAMRNAFPALLSELQHARATARWLDESIAKGEAALTSGTLSGLKLKVRERITVMDELQVFRAAKARLNAALLPARPSQENAPEHCCGARGFAESGDDCPGCVASGRYDRKEPR